jgi:hypothetical protein
VGQNRFRGGAALIGDCRQCGGHSHLGRTMTHPLSRWREPGPSETAASCLGKAAASRTHSKEAGLRSDAHGGWEDSGGVDPKRGTRRGNDLGASSSLAPLRRAARHALRVFSRVDRTAAEDGV